MLTDLAEGACSVLEREYLVRVERAHRLPGPARQLRVRTAGGVVYRDADHLAYGVIVELDGHSSTTLPVLAPTTWTGISTPSPRRTA